MFHMIWRITLFNQHNQNFIQRLHNLSKTMSEFYQHFTEPNRLWGRSLEFFLTSVGAPQLSSYNKKLIQHEIE